MNSTTFQQNLRGNRQMFPAGRRALSAVRFPADPRYYQIACLCILLVYGVTQLHFDVGPPQIVIIITTALLTQWLCARAVGLPRFDFRSPLISALSLCLLLRSNSLPILALAAIVAIGSKFVLRYHGKHIFNPTNLAIVAMLLLFGDLAWVSPAQWGSKTYFAFLLACLGGLVIYRAERSDVTLAFLLAYAALVFGRAAWLGDPWAIPLRQMQGGALLIFSFFMISDPKTTPDSRIGRILFAVLAALGAGFIQFVLYRTNGLLWSLALCSLLVPAIDRLFPGKQYQWQST